MLRSRLAIAGMLLITLLPLSLNRSQRAVALSAVEETSSSGSAQAVGERARAPEPSRMRVTLSAAHSTTSWDERDPDRNPFVLPLVYLHHEREATAGPNRTFDIHISGLSGGSEIQVEVLSHHADVSTGNRYRETRRFAIPGRPCLADDPCTIQWIFDPAKTPSDFYHLRVSDERSDLLWENPRPDQPDFVALDTWDVGFDDYRVRVYYAVLFPFTRLSHRPELRLAPAEVTDFVEGRFVPLIRDTWQRQLQDWGFGDPIHPDWDRDKVVEIIVTAPPFALFDGTGTYTVFTDAEGRPYPERRIWWVASRDTFQRYDLLANAYKVVFAHEFFHLAQWNVLLSTGHPARFWPHVFIEAQGKVAPAVQYPELEMRESHVVGADSAYINRANWFLAHQLNSSYRQLEAAWETKYDAALYWRFLYEQYNDMAVIRAALEEMANQYRPDIVHTMRDAMDQAFARLDGPFHTFEDSLTAFARANYALRLESGRCRAFDLTECGGFYWDPSLVYHSPPLEAEFQYDGTALTHYGSLPNSYGMDFIDVRLGPALHRRMLTVRFQGQGDVARFHVQIWKLGPGGIGPRAVTPAPHVVPQNADGAHVYAIPAVDTAAYDRLALIITRLDPDETADPLGAYRVTLD